MLKLSSLIREIKFACDLGSRSVSFNKDGFKLENNVANLKNPYDASVALVKG